MVTWKYLIRRLSDSPTKQLESRMLDLQSRISRHLPNNTAYLPGRDLSEQGQETMDEKLAKLDSKIAKIEALREAGRPEELRIKNLPNKYGRTGRFPAYPWYGSEVTHEDRLPHLSERLGKHGGPRENTITEMLQLNSDLNNPSFRSFFVQEPSREPDPDVNFEKGEILYENPDAFEGASLTRQIGYGSLGYICFYMYHTIASGRNVYPIGDEFMDTRAESNLTPKSWLYSATQSGINWHDLDSLSAYSFILPLGPIGVLSYIYMFHLLTNNVVTKMQLNADKDLLFISRLNGSFFASQYEEAFEVANLQVLPYAPNSGFEYINDRKWMTMTCMNTRTDLKLATDPKYWHPDLYQDFSKHLHSMWE